jgi:hypothetical protein
MENRSLKEITREADIALMAILDYWTQYDSDTILFTIAELNRRKVLLNEEMHGRIQEFCSHHHVDNFDTLLSQVLRRLGYYTYEAYYTEQILEPQQRAAQHQAQHSRSASSTQPHERRSSLRFLRALYILLGWFMLGITVLFTFLLSKLALVFALFAFAAGAVVVLALFGQARFIAVLEASEQ